MERNKSLNLIKLLACISVVFIHVSFPGLFGETVKNLSSWAVPVFIMIAGYYSFGCDESRILNRFKKAVTLLLFGYVVFFAYQMFWLIRTGNSFVEWFTENYNALNPVLFFVFCTVRWAIPLWYLIAMAETYLFWHWIVKRNGQNMIKKYVGLLFILEILATLLVDSKGLDRMTKVNFLTSFLPWFLLGYLIKEKYEKAIAEFSNFKIVLAIAIGGIITASSVILKLPINYSYLGTIVSAPAIFIWGVKNPQIRISNFPIYLGDKISLYVYIFHLPTAQLIYCFLIDVINTDTLEKYQKYHPLVTLIVVFIISILFEKIVTFIKKKVL